MEQDYFNILFYTNFSLVLIILFCTVEICIIIEICINFCIKYRVQDIYCEIEFN